MISTAASPQQPGTTPGHTVTTSSPMQAVAGMTSSEATSTAEMTVGKAPAASTYLPLPPPLFLGIAVLGLCWQLVLTPAKARSTTCCALSGKAALLTLSGQSHQPCNLPGIDHFIADKHIHHSAGDHGLSFTDLDNKASSGCAHDGAVAKLAKFADFETRGHLQCC